MVFGFGVIIGLGDNYWVCPHWMSIFFLDFCFHSGLLARVDCG